MPLRLLLLLFPLVEIALFVVIGGWIGVWGVLAAVVLGALAGILILRGRLARLPALLEAGRDPARLLAGGALTALGALLLIVPGFLSDALGLVLLLPPVQAAAGARLARSFGPGPGRGTAWQGTVIEGEYVVTRPGADAPGSADPDSDAPGTRGRAGGGRLLDHDPHPPGTGHDPRNGRH